MYPSFMIFKGSLSHKNNLSGEIEILSLLEHFKLTGAILALHTEAILPPLQNGRQSLVFSLIWKTDLVTRLTDPKNYLKIYIPGLRHSF